MTDENRKRNIADELTRAREALDVAKKLTELGYFNDAVSRAYYAVVHALRAALLSRGVEPKTHSGAIHLYNTELVRSGLMPTTLNRLLGGLAHARELADYDAAVRFCDEDARAEVANADTFMTAVLDLLRRDGWIAP